MKKEKVTTLKNKLKLKYKLRINLKCTENIEFERIYKMNGLKLLEIEYDGIFGIIADYTSDPNIMNYLSKLEKGIEKRDYETVKYSIEELIAWYDLNITKIRNNTFVNNFDSHYKNKTLLNEIHAILNPDDFVVGIADKASCLKSNNKLIFLSHKSKDKKYGDALRDFIVGLGVNNDQLIYTSHPLHKIPLDKNIYDYLRENINSEIFMIILWSDDYLESPACLNEMGAAWVTQSDYTNIYVPTFSFGNPKYHECAVDTRKMGAVLNGDAHCKANLIELKNKIQTLFDLQDDEQKSTYLIDRFISEISDDKT